MKDRLNDDFCYGTEFAAKVIGLDQTRIYKWMKDGYITASVHKQGRGTTNIFSFDDLCYMWTILKIQRGCASASYAGEVVRRMRRKIGQSGFTNAVYAEVASISGHVELVRHKQDLGHFFHDLSIVINLQKIVEEVRKRVEELTKAQYAVLK